VFDGKFAAALSASTAAFLLFRSLGVELEETGEDLVADVVGPAVAPGLGTQHFADSSVGRRDPTIRT
jgi:hypothetical protein